MWECKPNTKSVWTSHDSPTLSIFLYSSLAGPLVICLKTPPFQYQYCIDDSAKRRRTHNYFQLRKCYLHVHFPGYVCQFSTWNSRKISRTTLKLSFLPELQSLVWNSRAAAIKLVELLLTFPSGTSLKALIGNGTRNFAEILKISKIDV